MGEEERSWLCSCSVGAYESGDSVVEGAVVVDGRRGGLIVRVMDWGFGMLCTRFCATGGLYRRSCEAQVM